MANIPCPGCSHPIRELTLEEKKSVAVFMEEDASLVEIIGLEETTVVVYCDNCGWFENLSYAPWHSLENDWGKKFNQLLKGEASDKEYYELAVKVIGGRRNGIQE